MYPSLAVDDKEPPKLSEVRAQNIPSGIGDKTLDYFNMQLGSTAVDDKALKDLYKSVIKNASDLKKNPRALVRLGDIHLENNSPRKALRPYIEAINLDSNLIEAYRKVIRTYILLHNIKAADHYFQRLVSVTNNHPDYELEYTVFQLTSAHKEKTSEDIDRLLSKISSLSSNTILDEKTCVIIGAIYLAVEKNIPKAKELTLRAIEINPSNVYALNNLGIICQVQNKTEEAIHYYKKALALNPKFGDVYENLAVSYLGDNQQSEALSILDEGKKNGIIMSERSLSVYAWLLHGHERYYESKSILDQLTALDSPNIADYFNNLGVVWDKLNDTDAAVSAYKKSIGLVLNSDYDNSGVSILHTPFHNLLAIYAAQENFVKLKDLSKLLLNIDSSDPVGKYYRGAANLALKKYDNVEADLLYAINSNLERSHPYVLLSFFYSTVQKDYIKSIELLESVSPSLKNELVLNNLAYAYIKQGDTASAKQILDFSPEEPTTFATKGLLAYAEGDLDSGDKFYQKAINNSDKQKKQVIIAWKFEKANFHLSKGNIDDAVDLLDQLKSTKISYPLLDDALELRKQLTSGNTSK